MRLPVVLNHQIKQLFFRLVLLAAVAEKGSVVIITQSFVEAVVLRKPLTQLRKLLGNIEQVHTVLSLFASQFFNRLAWCQVFQAKPLKVEAN